jgi:hypothetical protein
MDSPVASALTAADERHLRRHHREELHVGLERQAGHVHDRSATACTSISGSTAISPLACGTPVAMRAAMSVAALPMSIWPQAMSYLRPSSEMLLVRPVTACLVAV